MAQATPFAYTPSGAIIDTATDTVVGSVSGISNIIGGVAMNPAGTRVYMLDYGFLGGNGMKVVNTATNSVITTVSAAERFGKVAVHPSGSTVYGTAGNSDLLVIDATTDTVITTVPLAAGGSISGIAVHPDGSRVYVARGGALSVIATATNTVMATITGLPDQAGAVAVNPSGTRVYAGYFANCCNPPTRTVIIDTATDTVVGSIPVWSPGLAINAAGTLMYGADGSSTVNVIDLVSETVIDTVTGLNQPVGIAVNPAGTKVYAIQKDSSGTAVIDTVTNTVTTTVSTGFANGGAGVGLFIGPFCPTGGCSDSNTCTGDTCNSISGACSYANNSASCDDGTFCNGADTCSGGACVLHPGDPCTGGSECADSCNEVLDNCFDPVTTACTSDGNVCTDDYCNAAGACIHPANTDPCDDGLFCNGADVCAAALCTHGGDPCTGGPECADACNEAADDCLDPSGTSCTADASVCTVDECDGTGICVHLPGNAGAECRADGGQCDVAEICDGLSPTCPPNGFEPDGTGCNDGAECTIEDQCTAGACGGNSMTCGDGTVQSGCNEDCDDGGFVNDDGCDDACQFEPCKPTPDGTCKPPFFGEKASIKLKNDTNDTKDSVQWKWNNGSQTNKSEFGNPLTTDDYWLCIYDNGALRSTTLVPFGGTCDGKPCWSDKPKGFQFKSKTPSIDGGTGVSLGAGDGGKAKAQFKGKGGNLDLPDLGAVTGPLVVQLVKSSGGVCWTATYSAPFAKDDGVSLSDKAD